MRPTPVCFALLLLACSCQRAVPQQDEASLLSAVKAGLSERERKLSSYHLVGTVKQGELTQPFDFHFRAPHRMRGELTGVRTFSFDGTTLFDLEPAKRSLTAYELKLGREEGALMLSSIFKPFIPEGYRTPLLLREGVRARRTSHPKAIEAVEVLQEVTEGADRYSVRYVFRLPTMDFLAKEFRQGEQRASVSVVAEHCDERLKLCVPKKLEESTGAAVSATTELSRVELNTALPQDAFTLAAPEGFVFSEKQWANPPAP